MSGEDLLREILLFYSKYFLKQKETGAGGCQNGEQIVLVFDAWSVPFPGGTVRSRDLSLLTGIKASKIDIVKKYLISSKVKGGGERV